VARLAAWAAARGRDVAELAIAWLASQPGVGPVIAGATRPEQAQANAAAADWTLTANDVDHVGAIARCEIVP
jgi:aryl-alcohol dehydrogenase-like predicted oxidoreductase